MTSGVRSRCDECREPVVDGPEGGYCCSYCGHSVDPPRLVMERRQKEWDRRAAIRAEIREEIRATRPRRSRS